MNKQHVTTDEANGQWTAGMCERLMVQLADALVEVVTGTTPALDTVALAYVAVGRLLSRLEAEEWEREDAAATVKGRKAAAATATSGHRHRFDVDGKCACGETRKRAPRTEAPVPDVAQAPGAE